MKSKLLIILIVLIISSCVREEGPYLKPKTIIAGEILGYNKSLGYNSLELILPDILTHTNKIKRLINDKGKFKFTLELDMSTNGWLSYANVSFPIFIESGDSMHLTIDKSFINGNFQNTIELYSHLKVQGSKQKLNEEIYTFLAMFDDSIVNHTALNDSLKKLEAIPAKNFMQHELERHYNFLEKFNSEHQTSAHFQQWATNYLKFRRLSVMMQYPAFHLFLNGEKPAPGYLDTIPTEYYNFLDSVDIFMNKENYEVFTYTNFIRSYVKFINQNITRDSVEYINQLFDTDFEKANTFYINYYNSLSDTFLKDLLIADYYYYKLDNQYYNKLKYLIDFDDIGNEILAKKVKEKFYMEQQIYENPKSNSNAKVNEFIKQNEFLKELIAKNKSRMIFIDFWAPWCKPCMAEIPYGQKIKDDYKSKDIVFVYLANNCSENSWKSTIEEKRIKGEHYLLTKKQYQELSEIFGINGIPHYVLLDKNGNVVSKFAPRPSNEKELKILIDKYI